MSKDRYHVSGYTLLEVMLVVAIVGILASVAYPAYQSQLQSGRRADAQTVLLEAAQYMERFYTENSRYDQNVSGTSVAIPTGLRQAPIDSSPKFYNITLPSVTSTTYTLRATPINAQLGDGYLEYTNAGVKRWDRDNNGSIGSGERCWQKQCS